MANKVNYTQALILQIFFIRREKVTQEIKQNPENWGRDHFRLILVVKILS